MKVYTQKNTSKWIGLGLLIFIIIALIWSVNVLIKKFRADELQHVELWSNAMKTITNNENLNTDISFATSIIENNKDIPIIYTDQEDKVILTQNVPENIVTDQVLLRQTIEEYSTINHPILVVLPNNLRTIYYGESSVLQLIKWAPFIIAFSLIILVLGSMLIIRLFSQSEKNLLWAAMAKEAAHQIGTPLSSLIGWIELLKTEDIAEDTLLEMEKDVHRLDVISDRFSKIGSAPKLYNQEIIPIVKEPFEYISKRYKYIDFKWINNTDDNCTSHVNKTLLNWVIENLLKNAIDALDGKGEIEMTLTNDKKYISIFLRDNGKGIKKNQIKHIFSPGFTTKKRGWGIGLSLSKRIIEKYFKGTIGILKTDVDRGTTFKIQIPLTDLI